MADTILEVRHLMKQFDDLMVLKDINLTVHEGEVIVIVGPSGCGKSTFLRCINALEDIQGGEIRLNGELVSKESHVPLPTRLADLMTHEVRRQYQENGNGNDR